jgi:hypothetical protein
VEGLQLGPGDGVEGAERLVHQHDLGLRRERARHRHPLALAAGEIARPALAILLRLETHEAQRPIGQRRRTVAPPQPGHQGHVAPHPPVRQQPAFLRDATRRRSAIGSSTAASPCPPAPGPVGVGER